MDNSSQQRASRQVAAWLLIGVAMIIIQVLLGGVTRLTESGLSITEWKPITGILPPLNDSAWQVEFDKYKLTDQFKYVHADFSLAQFKFIFFWEWFHRLWARLMGLVFLAGFIYFLITKKFSRPMIRPMVILFFLGVMQGVIGWIMVRSGLVPEKYFVGHIELTTHFIAALGLLCYTLWFAQSLLITPRQMIVNVRLRNFVWVILAVLFFQLIYGGFMAGLKAAITAPTWPDINGQMIPSTMNELKPGVLNLVNNPIAIQFIHRGLAYLLFILIIIFWFKAKSVQGNTFFSIIRDSLLILITLQVALGIVTVLNATWKNRLIWLGVTHQFIAMLLLVNMVMILFTLRKNAIT